MSARKAIIATLFTAVFLFGAAGFLDAGEKAPIGLRARVDRRAITIGDRVKYTLAITARKGTVVELPKFANYKIGPFEIKDSGSRMQNALFGRKRYTVWYSITCYDAGAQTIPAMEVRFRLKGRKQWSSSQAPSIDIDVESVLPKGGTAADIRDIKAPLAIRNPYYGIIALALALAVFITITIAVYARMKRYVPVRLPHETALEELEAIRAAFLQGGDIKIYFVGVSDTIRRYIEHAFRLRAPEMTTEEFLDSLRDSRSLTMPQKELLRGFMNACDLVKFAKYAPTHDEAEAVYTTARSFVEETRDADSDARV